MSERGSFSGKIGFIMATAGSAVGLGNIWRFPTMAASHGGGAFLLAYIIIVVVFGLAMVCTEIALGRMTRKSPIDAYGTLRPRAKIIGVLSTLVPALIYPYYCVVGGWIIGYLGYYLAGSDCIGIFGDFSGSYLAVLTTIVFISIVGIIVYLGVDRGIEKLSTIFMPVFLILLVILVVYVLFQPGSMGGMEYFLLPDLSHVDASVFTSALGQAFFSLSLAMGITITYGSYMKKQDSIQRSSMTVIVIDSAIAILAGLLIVPIAYNAFGESMPSGAGLVFVALPEIFTGMPGGTLVAIFFFIMLFIAAVTSAVSILEAVVSTIIDRFHATRHRAVLFVTLPTLVVGTLISLGFGPLDWINIAGKGLLDLFDFASNTVLMPVVALLMCIFIGHVIGPKVITDEIESSGGFSLKRIYPILIKWVFPVFLAIILVTGVLGI
ncbi:MAG: sodium-dependent transporter [archaeon]|nr:sodium-dependent transporter [archaeon]